MTVDFVIILSLESLLLSELAWKMRLDTISSSSSESAANSFNFRSKVEFFCVMSFLRALLEFNLASLEVVVAEPSVNPSFFFLMFLTSSLRASLHPFTSVLFYFLPFPKFEFFLDFVDEDALAFTVALSISDSALDLRNRILSAEPPPELVLSPPPAPSAPLPSLSQVFSLAPVL